MSINGIISLELYAFQAAKLEPNDNAVRRRLAEARKKAKAARKQAAQAYGALFGRGEEPP